MLASSHRPAGRLGLLNPFDPERETQDEPEAARSHDAASAYGCVEWFHYLDPTPAVPVAHTATRRRAPRRP